MGSYIHNIDGNDCVEDNDSVDKIDNDNHHEIDHDSYDEKDHDNDVSDVL